MLLFVFYSTFWNKLNFLISHKKADRLGKNKNTILWSPCINFNLYLYIYRYQSSTNAVATFSISDVIENKVTVGSILSNIVLVNRNMSCSILNGWEFNYISSLFNIQNLQQPRQSWSFNAWIAHLASKAVPLPPSINAQNPSGLLSPRAWHAMWSFSLKCLLSSIWLIKPWIVSVFGCTLIDPL